jgi:peptide/nickel transport system permease protein
VSRGTPRPSGPWRDAWRRFRKDKLAVAALAYLVLVSLAGAFHGLIQPHDPRAQLLTDPFAGPSGSHWLGADDFGRDVVSRLLEGAGVSMRFSLIVVAGTLLVALPLGLVSGYIGGRLDNVLMRIMDAIMSLPGLVLAISLIAVLGLGAGSAMLAIGISMVPGLTRVVRGQALAVREETFIEASRSIGTPSRQVLTRHMLPNILSPLIVQTSIILGLTLLAEASLSFLGLGVQPPTASWGSMLQRANQFVLKHPWHVMPPGLAIAFTVFAFNLVGDGLRTALGSVQPTRRRGRLGLTTVRRPAPDPSEPPASKELLVVRDLCVDFDTPRGTARVVDGISFSVAAGETLGLAGESGSGKTVSCLSIMRLLPSPPATIAGGSVHFEGRDLLSLPFNDTARLRGSEIAMIFQDPMASLNPSQTIEHQIAQVVRWHESISAKDARRRAHEALDMVGVSAKRARSYPHEFSGGMRQRAMIAMALVCRPKLLIADEPTTALDVTVQAQVLELLHSLRRDLGMAMIFVTHDLGVVADICDRVAVMYAGQIVETASASDFFAAPRHPYSQGLLRSMPQGAAPRTPLYVIPGSVPSFHELGEGCRLVGRCEYATDVCREGAVDLRLAGENHEVRCVLVENVSGGVTE